MTDNIWGTLNPEEISTTRHLSLGRLHLWFQFRDEEIWIDRRYEDQLDPADPPVSEHPPEPAEWSRWAVGGSSSKLQLSPVFPDLPVVVSSEYPLKIIPGTGIDIFTRIPVWIRFSWGREQHVITEIPTVKLSKTWFGIPVEGELAYWSTTKARRSLSEVEGKPYVVNCPIRITNDSSEDLNFEKFCYRVERLKIFQSGGELWSDETRIRYRGEDQISDISMSGKLPGEMEGTLMNGPRQPDQSSLATRTFRKLIDEYTFLGR